MRRSKVTPEIEESNFNFTLTWSMRHDTEDVMQCALQLPDLFTEQEAVEFWELLVIKYPNIVLTSTTRKVLRAKT